MNNKAAIYKVFFRFIKDSTVENVYKNIWARLVVNTGHISVQKRNDKRFTELLFCTDKLGIKNEKKY